MSSDGPKWCQPGVLAAFLAASLSSNSSRSKIVVKSGLQFQNTKTTQISEPAMEESKSFLTSFPFGIRPITCQAPSCFRMVQIMVKNWGFLLMLCAASGFVRLFTK